MDQEDRALSAGSCEQVVVRASFEPLVGFRFHLCGDLERLRLCCFVIDTYARCIGGWRASRTAHADFVLDALGQALHDRRPLRRDGLVYHSDKGSQYLFIKYTERLAEAGIEPSVSSIGDSYDNALADTINGLYKDGVITGEVHGVNLKPLSSQHLNGSIGSTIADCLNPLGTSCRRSRVTSL